MKPEIELNLLRLADGGRVLRLSDPLSGLCLEKKLDPRQPVVEQKERWLRAFLAMLEREVRAAG